MIRATSRIASLRARSSRAGRHLHEESPGAQLGKTCDLAFGYMGGLGAWRKFEPEQFTDDEVETFKNEWRAAHPKIVPFWHDLDRAARTAVRERGRVVRCGRVAYKCTGAFL